MFAKLNRIIHGWQGLFFYAQKIFFFERIDDGFDIQFDRRILRFSRSEVLSVAVQTIKPDCATR